MGPRARQAAPGPAIPASALRWLLIGVPTNLALDTGVLVGATVAGITVLRAAPAVPWPWIASRDHLRRPYIPA